MESGGKREGALPSSRSPFLSDWFFLPLFAKARSLGFTMAPFVFVVAVKEKGELGRL